MANVTREIFCKVDFNRADVEAQGSGRVDLGVAESYTVEDDGDDWVLVTVLKQIS